MSVTDAICGARAAHCRCTKPRHPATEPHVCQHPDCNGSWRGNYSDHTFTIVRLPGLPCDSSR